MYSFPSCIEHNYNTTHNLKCYLFFWSISLWNANLQENNIFSDYTDQWNL